tara:strand:- start:223 stop:618 length:396 start_codon:yes stop_codon:yes gene_type:complete
MEKMGKQQFSNEEIREAIKELLSGQKVELSVFADLRSKLIKIASKKMDNANKLVDELEGQKKKINTRVKSLDELKKAIDKIHREYMALGDKAANELGIAPAKIPDFKKVNDVYFYLSGQVRDLQAVLKKYL